MGGFVLGALLLLLATTPATSAQEATQRIAYVGEDGNIWLVRADGGDKQQVTTYGTAQRGFHAPQWSPDGTMLTFHGDIGDSSDDMKFGIFIARPGAVEQVPNIRQCAHPFFTDGGASIAFSCNLQFDTPVTEQQFQDPAHGALSASGLDGSNWHVVVPFALSTALDPTGGIMHVAHVSISPRDGSMLFNEPLQDGVTSRALVPANGGPAVSWPGGAADGSLSDVTYAPDGNVVGVRCRCPFGSPVHASIVELKNDGSNERAIVALTEGAAAESPAVSPDGTKVAYGDRRADSDGTDHLRLMVVPRQGGTASMIAAGTEPAWQPQQAAFGAGQAQPATQPATTATTAPTDNATQAIRAAIDRANAAWTSATQSLDPAVLDGAVAGDELQADRDQLERLRAGNRTRKNVNTAFTVLDVNQDAPGHAIVHTRETWYAENYDSASGALIDRTPETTYTETYVVEQVNGGWIVTRNDLQ